MIELHVPDVCAGRTGRTESAGMAGADGMWGVSKNLLKLVDKLLMINGFN